MQRKSTVREPVEMEKGKSLAKKVSLGSAYQCNALYVEPYEAKWTKEAEKGVNMGKRCQKHTKAPSWQDNMGDVAEAHSFHTISDLRALDSAQP